MRLLEAVMSMPNESFSAQVSAAGGPTLRGALLWAAVGAALFLGVGAAMPIWEVPRLVEADHRGTKYPVPRWTNGHGPWWESFHRVASMTPQQSLLIGIQTSPGMAWDPGAGAVLLVICGAGVGLIGYAMRKQINWCFELKGSGV